MTKKKVMVNILNQGTTTTGWETQIVMWTQDKIKDYTFKIFFPHKRPITSNRNQIVKDFLEGDWDYLVMLDDDNPCHKNIFDLLDLDLPVVGGVYPGRDDYGITFFAFRHEGKSKNGRPSFKIYPPEERVGLKKVDAIGAGLIVIRRDVLEKIRDAGFIPFENTDNKDGTLPYNEDMGFCMKCKKLGIDIYAHYDYLGSHWKEVDLLWIAGLVAYAAKTGKTNFPHEDE